LPPLNFDKKICASNRSAGFIWTPSARVRVDAAKAISTL
jgi:hypothetical protein